MASQEVLCIIPLILHKTLSFDIMDLLQNAGMPLAEAIRYIQDKRKDYRCVEVKYADQVQSTFTCKVFGSCFGHIVRIPLLCCFENCDI